MATNGNSFRVTGIDVVGYPDVLGLEPTTTYPDGTGCEYEFDDGTTFELYNSGPNEPFRPGNGLMLGVTDWKAAVASAKAAGAAILTETETPVCFMALIEDTEGNALVIHFRKTPLSR